MTRRQGQMRLGAFHYISGHHIAARRHPDASRDDRLEDFVNFACMAESAKFDAIFLADSVDVRLLHPDGAARKAHTGITPFEPLTLLSALAAVTSHIGLIGTASTTFSDPYNLARQFASLDHIRGGRAGWNLVTSNDPEAAPNFGHAAPGRIGHRLIVGTPQQIADDIEAWFRAGAADGFNLMPDVLPDGLDSFVDTVVPLLREKCIFRQAYTGSTLREHFGLAHPAASVAASRLVA